jgi:signal transduction histidine kinase
VRRPRDWSVRARTTVAGLAVLAPVLGGAALAGVLVQGHELTRAAATVAEEQARLVARQIGADGTGPGGVSTTLGGDGLVQVVGPDGVVDASSPLRDRPPLTGLPPVGGTTEAELSNVIAGEEDRYLAVGVRVADTTSYVVAVRSLESVDAATASTARLFAIGVPAVLALVAALTWLLAGRALAPVEQLRRRVSEISVAGTGVRLPAVSTRDEIGRLAETLNEMLTRLDASARGQRQFIADASHELRSPVAAIRTVMEVSASAPSDPDEVRADVLAETRRLEVLVDGLLALARRDAMLGTPVPPRGLVDLADLIVELGERPRRTTLEMVLDEGVVVSGDRHALALLVGCLLDNADRHAHVRIRVSVGHHHEAATVMVCDDGDGVADEDRDRIFDRFVRLDEARTRDSGGAGLGLAIARAVAEEHGGTLRCEAPTSGSSGACFVLTLPMRASEAPSQAASAPRAEDDDEVTVR